MRGPVLVAAACATWLALAACGSESASSSAPGSSGTAGGSRTASASVDSSVEVLAASSLTDAFGAIQQDFQKAHPGAAVKISYEASSDIVSQVDQGAPVDVVAFADTDSLARLRKGALVGKEVIIAKNRLEIATPPDNPGKVGSLQDLAKPTVQIVVCDPQVPCGKGAAKVLAAANIRANIVSLEQNVRTALLKVEHGDADAAIVYHSDVVAAGSAVHGVVIAPSQNQVQAYPVQAVSHNWLAAAFVRFTTGRQARDVLRRYGFLAP